VGGGATALRKLQKLLPYGPRLTVAAPDICREIRAVGGLTLLDQPFAPDLLAGMAFVVAATDDPALNRRIAALCKADRIPVNVVDDRAACTFLFPALVQRGSLSIGISTGGSSPTAAIYWKERIASLLPEGLEEILADLEAQRAPVKELLADEGARAACFAQLFAASMEAGRPLLPEERAAVLRPFLEEETT
jgi:siroheme synthase-like protein